MMLPDGDWLLTNRLSLSASLTEEAPRADAEAATLEIARGGPVNLLHADAGLAAALSTAQLIQAAPHAHVRTLMLSVGDWDPVVPRGEGGSADWLGLLVLDGFLSLETSYERETALEIVGPGDLPGGHAPTLQAGD